MIYTKIKNIERYLGQSSSLDTAIRYLLSADLSKLGKATRFLSTVLITKP